MFIVDRLPICLIACFAAFVISNGFGLAFAVPPDGNGALRDLRRLHPRLRIDHPREFPMRLYALQKSPYEFFRGTADVFYQWCSTHCRDWMEERAAFVTLHGDVHIGNLGTYLRAVGDAPSIDFGVVDFDDTFAGPFQLDLLRGLTSLRFVAGDFEENLTEADWNDIAARLCDAYVSTLNHDTRFEKSRHVNELMNKASRQNWDEQLEKYITHKQGKHQFRRCRVKKGRPTDILEQPDDAERRNVVSGVLNARLLEEESMLAGALGLSPSAAAEHSVLDIARWTRIDSSGSQGLHKYLVLIRLPPDREADAPASRERESRIGRTDMILLELKEEPPPAAARSGLLKDQAGAEDRAREVAEAHRIFRCSTPCIPAPFVGHTQMGDRSFLVRLKDPWSEELEEDGFDDGRLLRVAAEIMGSAIAAAHAGSLVASGQQDKDGCLRRICRAAEQLSPALVARSKASETHLRVLYKSFQDDEETARLAAQAKAFIDAHCAAGR